MNTPRARKLLLAGLGTVALLTVVMPPTKKQTVIWGIGGELDKVNGEADVQREREKIFG